MASTVSGLISQRRGHFQMESGYHSAVWSDLGALFEHPLELGPLVSELAGRLSSHGLDAVCGPQSGGAKLAAMIASELDVGYLVAERFDTRASGMFPIAYRIPASQRRSARGRPVAIVAEVI